MDRGRGGGNGGRGRGDRGRAGDRRGGGRGGRGRGATSGGAAGGGSDGGGWSRAPCKFFNTPNGCWFGDRCQFEHSQSDGRTDRSADAGRGGGGGSGGARFGRTPPGNERFTASESKSRGLVSSTETARIKPKPKPNRRASGTRVVVDELMPISSRHSALSSALVHWWTAIPPELISVILSYAISHPNHTCLVGGADGFRVFDADFGSELVRVRFNPSNDATNADAASSFPRVGCTAACALPDTPFVVAGCDSGEIMLFEQSDGGGGGLKWLGSYQASISGPVIGVCLWSDHPRWSRRFVSVTKFGDLIIWEITSDKSCFVLSRVATNVSEVHALQRYPLGVVITTKYANSSWLTCYRVAVRQNEHLIMTDSLNAYTHEQHINCQLPLATYWSAPTATATATANANGSAPPAAASTTDADTSGEGGSSGAFIPPISPVSSFIASRQLKREQILAAASSAADSKVAAQHVSTPIASSGAGGDGGSNNPPVPTVATTAAAAPSAPRAAPVPFRLTPDGFSAVVGAARHVCLYHQNDYKHVKHNGRLCAGANAETVNAVTYLPPLPIAVSGGADGGSRWFVYGLSSGRLAIHADSNSDRPAASSSSDSENCTPRVEWHAAPTPQSNIVEPDAKSSPLASRSGSGPITCATTVPCLSSNAHSIVVATGGMNQPATAWNRESSTAPQLTAWSWNRGSSVAPTLLTAVDLPTAALCVAIIPTQSVSASVSSPVSSRKE